MVEFTDWIYQSMDYISYVEMFEQDFNWDAVLYSLDEEDVRVLRELSENN